MSIFTDNLKRLLHDANTTYAAMSREISISKNGLKYWETNGNLPSGDILDKIAKYLNVDISELVSAESKSKLSPDEAELIAIYQKLNVSKKRQLLGKAYELQDSQESKSDAAIAPPHVDLAALGVRDRQIKK